MVRITLGIEGMTCGRRDGLCSGGEADTGNVGRETLQCGNGGFCRFVGCGCGVHVPCCAAVILKAPNLPLTNALATGWISIGNIRMFGGLLLITKRE